MAQQTFLQLTNRVLKNLRKSSTGTVAANEFSALVGSWVNRAKEKVESLKQWEALQQQTVFDCTGSDNDYDLVSPLTLAGGAYTNDKSSLLYDDKRKPMVYDITDQSVGQGYQLLEIDGRALRRQRSFVVYTASIPTTFSVRQTGAGLRFELLETPTGVRRYSVGNYTPQAELSADGDVLLAPWVPVVDYATFLAADERGEELGIDANTWMTNYNQSLWSARMAETSDDEMMMEPD